MSSRTALCLATLLAVGCGDSAGPSAATHLAFVVEPTSAGVGSPMAPAVVVAARDARDRTVWSWHDTVTVTLVPSGAATLEGTTRTLPVSGTTVFDDLTVANPGDEYRLVASSGALTEALSVPFAVHAPFLARTVVAGNYHTCALTADSVAYCWGGNQRGQLGVGDFIERAIPTPVATSLRFASLAAGGWHTCGLTASGAAYCWGGNAYGQLGIGTADSTAPVTPVAVAPAFTALTAGTYHSCGLTNDSRIFCWGNNAFGQLGDGTDTLRTAPTATAGGVAFASVSTGFTHTCGLTAAGEAYCWGYNLYGEVGDSTRVPRYAPTPVSGGHRFTAVSAGGGTCHHHTCGIATDGTTYCWGRNYQRGITSTDIWLLAPTALGGDPGLHSVTVGSNVVCGLRDDGALYCWGTGYLGQVGNGQTTATTMPAHIRPDLQFTDLASGRYHTCAVTTDDVVYCWGGNTEGQLGSSANRQGWTIPVVAWRP